MKTWKDETIKRELNRLAEGLQEVDKTIISYVRISMGNLSDTRTVTAYTNFAKDEWLFKVTFNFEINTMTVECGRLEPYTKKISSLKSSVNYCLESFNTSFDEFESYYGVPYKHYLSTTKTEDVAEETTDEPTPEEADREVTYIDFKPEQDYSEEEPKAENSKVKAVAQYLSSKITGWYENARIDYGVSGKFLSCKAEGENGIRINWEEEGKEYTMVINWFTEYTTEHLYNIWMEQGVEVEEVEKQPKEEEQQVVTIDNTQLFLKELTKSFDAAGFATSYKELYQGTYSIHAIADQGVMVDVGFNEGVPCKTSASAVVYSGTDCIIIDCTKYNTETEFIKAIIEKVISASVKEKEFSSKATKFFESTDSTDNKVRKLRKEFKQWELLQEREKEADEAYEANYKNKELEKAADEAFEAEYKQYDKIARMIAELINVEVLTAKSMLTNRAERVKKILGL